MEDNSHDQSSPGRVQMPLTALDLPNSQNFSERREEDDKLAESLCTHDTTLEMHQMHQCNKSQ